MPTDEELRSHVRDIVLRVLSEQGPARSTPRSIAIGTDHGGLELRQNLLPYLRDLGYAVTDCGTFTTDPVDYPDTAYAVAKLVSDGAVSRGIVIDGAGIGSCMAANKVPGVRAAMCYDARSARNSREHNNANVLTLGGRMISTEAAREIVRIFLETECTEERHLKRVQKIMDIEKRFLRK